MQNSSKTILEPVAFALKPTRVVFFHWRALDAEKREKIFNLVFSKENLFQISFANEDTDG